MKKVWAYLACGLLACSMAVGFTVISTSAPKSEVFAGINYYAQHHGGTDKWKARAGVACRTGSVIGAACMKAALIGSGAGPVGSFVAVAAVGL